MVFTHVGKNYALHICIDSCNYRINLTTNSKPNPYIAPNFCMFLRKHIIGSKIKSISNYDLERVITIELEGYNDLNDLINKKLIIELMGRHSNIILTNSKNIILDSLRHIEKSDLTYRNILPIHEYTYPISNKLSLSKTNFSDFNTLLNLENIYTIAKKISSLFIGISQNLIEYSISYLNISIISEETLKLLFSYLQELIDLSDSDKISCNVYLNSNNKQDYTIIKNKKETNLDINFFIDDFYNNKENIEIFINYRNNILKLINNLLKKYNKRLENINLKLNECSNMETFKKYGELIVSNLYKLSNNNISYIELEDYYNDNKTIKIPLDKTISPSNNAKKYFKKYNKLKNTLVVVNKQKQDTKKELEYIESIIYELQLAKNIQEIDDIYMEIQENLFNLMPNYKKKKEIKNKKNEISPLEYEVNGYKVLVGKNNMQNDYITVKTSSNTDIWFHTQEIHGSHVILKTNKNKLIDNDTLYKCAEIAAKHSQAKHSHNIPVDYTLVKYVKKPNGAKPGKVAYTNQKTIYVRSID